MTIQNIIDAVEICMDEIQQNDAEFEGTQDDTDRSKIIQSKISEALTYIYMHADWSLLKPTTAYSSKQSVTLPEGFIRLLYATCSSWSRSLGQEDIITWNDPAFAMISDTYVGATNDRPAVTIEWSGSSKTLNLYPTTSSGSIGIMEAPGDYSSSSATDTIDVPKSIYRALIYCITGLVYITYGDQTRSSMMFEQANDILGISAAQAGSQQQVQ